MPSCPMKSSATRDDRAAGCRVAARPVRTVNAVTFIGERGTIDEFPAWISRAGVVRCLHLGLWRQEFFFAHRAIDVRFCHNHLGRRVGLHCVGRGPDGVRTLSTAGPPTGMPSVRGVPEQGGRCPTIPDAYPAIEFRTGAAR